MYIATLTLSLFLAVFSAVLLAVFLGAQLAAPLLLLAEGVRQVAAGDLTPKAVLKSKDELGGLTRSFADMTQQLFDARAAVDSSMVQVNTARENLQIILDNLTSGVIVLDVKGAIQSFNPGAARILRSPLRQFVGELSFPGDHRVITPRQRVDGVHHRAEFLLLVAVAQRRRLANIQRVYIS